MKQAPNPVPSVTPIRWRALPPPRLQAPMPKPAASLVNRMRDGSMPVRRCSSARTFMPLIDANLCSAIAIPFDEVERRGHRYAEARDGARAGFLHAGSQRAVPRGENLLRRLVFGDFDFGVGLPRRVCCCRARPPGRRCATRRYRRRGRIFRSWLLVYLGLYSVFAFVSLCRGRRHARADSRAGSLRPLAPMSLNAGRFSFRSRAVSPCALRNIASKDTKITGTAAIPPFAQVVQ